MTNKDALDWLDRQQAMNDGAKQNKKFKDDVIAQAKFKQNDNAIQTIRTVLQRPSNSFVQSYAEGYNDAVDERGLPEKIDEVCHRTVCEEDAAHRHLYNGQLYCDFCATEINRQMKRCGEKPCFEFKAYHERSKGDV